MGLYKDIIIYKVFRKLIYFAISIFIISIYVFLDNSNVYAAVPRCNLNGGALFGSAEIIVSSSNGQPLPSNLAVHAQTATCPGGPYSPSTVYSGYGSGQVPGFDNGSVTNPSYNSNSKDWQIGSSVTEFKSSTDISNTELKDYAISHNKYAPTYQDFGNIPLISPLTSITPTNPKGEINCPPGYGCNPVSDPKSVYPGYYNVTFNSAHTTAYIEFYQVLDCGFSYLDYNIVSGSLTGGWTVQSVGLPIPISNAPPSNNPTGTIIVAPPIPTITSISQSCPNASGTVGEISWTLSNYNYPYTLHGYLVTPSKSDLYGFSVTNQTVGSTSGTFIYTSPTPISSNQAYFAYLEIDIPGVTPYPNNETSTTFNYSQCVKTPPPPTLTINLSCNFSWNSTGFQSGDTVNYEVANTTSHSFNFITGYEYTGEGKVSNIFPALSYEKGVTTVVYASISYGSNITPQLTSKSYNLSKCSTPPTVVKVGTVSIKANLTCSLRWYVSGFSTGDKVSSVSIGIKKGSYFKELATTSSYSYASIPGTGTYLYSNFYKSLPKIDKSTYYTGRIVVLYGPGDKKTDIAYSNSSNFTTTTNCSSTTTTSGCTGSSCTPSGTPLCGVNSLLNCPPPGVPTSSGSPLNINGSIVGYGGVYSFRDLGGGDLTTPAVSIVFNPNFLSVYDELFISNLGYVIQYWIEPGI